MHMMAFISELSCSCLLWCGLYNAGVLDMWQFHLYTDRLTAEFTDEKKCRLCCFLCSNYSAVKRLLPPTRRLCFCNGLCVCVQNISKVENGF